MAFALTKYAARGVEIMSPSKKRGIQQVIIQATGTTSDVDLDLGDAGGTFWTAAIANATYGAIATAALASLQAIAAQAVSPTAQIYSPQLVDRVQVASLTTTGQYTVTADTIAPDIAFNAADGELTYYIVLTYQLNDFISPAVVELG